MKKRILALLLVLTLCFALVPCTALAEDTALTQAQALQSLGLFKGDGTEGPESFALTRGLTRVEAIVMLLRLLGRETAALETQFEHPFEDVPDWANGYIGYAYENAMTNGEEETVFGTGDATAAMYLTFVLRALGYDDADGDFSWEKPFALAGALGILPAEVDRENFLRADAVLVSYAALFAKMKDSNETLAEKLISAGVFTKAQFDALNPGQDEPKQEEPKQEDPKQEEPAGEKKELDAEAIYEKTSKSVFYLEVYNAEKKKLGSGSGFFIGSDGTAVTNFHVLQGAASAKATIAETDKTYSVEGIYDYSIDGDWAVIKIKETTRPFETLAIGASNSIVGGAPAYAVGSPLGLQNTISEGLISNPSREEGGKTYIQTSAAISAGSSGGALINKYGEVIGITSASYVEGQNLNLALPISVIDGYRKDTLHTFNDLNTAVCGKLGFTATPSAFSLAVGETADVTVSVTAGSSEYLVLATPEEEGIVSGYFRTSWTKNQITLTVMGIEKGSTMVTVTLYDAAQMPIAYAYLFVTVKEQAVSAANAFDFLASYAQKNGKRSVNDTYTYCYASEGSRYTGSAYYLVYDAKNDTVTVVAEDYDTATSTTSEITIPNGLASPYEAVFCESAKRGVQYGYARIYPQFLGDKSLNFYQKDAFLSSGSAGTMSKHLVEALRSLNATILIGRGYSIRNLGFTAVN